MGIKKQTALAKRAFECAQRRGIYSKSDYVEKELFEDIMTEMTELTHAATAGRHADVEGFIDDSERRGRDFIESYDEHIRNTIEDKIADVIITTYSILHIILNGQGIDTDEADDNSFIYQRSKPIKHQIFQIRLRFIRDLLDYETTTALLQFIGYMIDFSAANCKEFSSYFVYLKMQYNELRTD